MNVLRTKLGREKPGISDCKHQEAAEMRSFTGNQWDDYEIGHWKFRFEKETGTEAGIGARGQVSQCLWSTAGKLSGSRLKALARVMGVIYPRCFGLVPHETDVVCRGYLLFEHITRYMTERLFEMLYLDFTFLYCYTERMTFRSAFAE